SPAHGARSPRSLAAASPNPGVLTITETAETLPASNASQMPRLTASESPKSSALMTTRARSFTRASAIVSAAASAGPNPGHLRDHRAEVVRESDGARLVVVVERHRDLLDSEALASRNVETLDVEGESGDGHVLEDGFGGLRGEALEPRLGVVQARQ